MVMNGVAKMTKKKVFNKLISLALSVSTLVCPLVYSIPAFAEPRLEQINQEKTTNTSQNSMTMRQKLEASKNSIVVSKIQKGEAYIPGGTELTVEVVDEITSKKSKTGEFIKLKLLDNVIINDVIVIPAGASVDGHITKAKGSGMFGRAGTLEFSIDSVKTINNIVVPLEYVGRIKAGNDGGAIAVVAFASILGGAFMKGENVRIPAGTKILAKVTTDTDLMTKLDNLAEAMNPEKPHGVSITIK